jgi:two-component system chemotaxis response regulator CheY
MNTIKVVVADDDNITRHLLRTLLRQHYYEVVGEANNGTDALELCTRLRPDVLILDINMPKMNGFEVLKHIRRSHPDLAVIMISSDPTPLNVQEARAYGINEFIVKPFNAAQVVTAITRSQT